jgi:hypothetical protein
MDMNESASKSKKNTAKGSEKKAAPKAKSSTKTPAATSCDCQTPAPKAAAPAPKAPAPKAAIAASVTTVVAKVDVGFGNILYLRGTGPGLSWEKGVEMTNTGSDEWTWSTNKASKTFLAKVLINDVTWSGDPDSTIVPGTKTVIQATF